MELQNLREEYRYHSLDDDQLKESPYEQFELWFREYQASGAKDANAMTLSTLGADGFPKSRIVLLKELNPQGFVFFTNYHSDKGQQLSAHPKASLLFFWKEHERQVRIEGEVEKIDEQASETYFQSRPYLSQLGALASDQSAAIESRAALEAKFTELMRRYPEGSRVPRPAHWGGLLLRPVRFEFWQGREGRLHDRMVFEPQASRPNGDANSKWHHARLQP